MPTRMRSRSRRCYPILLHPSSSFPASLRPIYWPLPLRRRTEIIVLSRGVPVCTLGKKARILKVLQTVVNMVVWSHERQPNGCPSIREYKTNILVDPMFLFSVPYSSYTTRHFQLTSIFALPLCYQRVPTRCIVNVFHFTTTISYQGVSTVVCRCLNEPTWS
jgi:hypothetical protein